MAHFVLEKPQLFHRHNVYTQLWTFGVRIYKMSLYQLYKLSCGLYTADFLYALLLIRQLESQYWKKNQKNKLQLNSHSVYYHFFNS